MFIFWRQGIILMRIFTNLSLGLTVFVVISGVPHISGYKATCTSTPPEAHQIESGSVLNLTCVSVIHRLLAWFKDGNIVPNSIRSVQLPRSKVLVILIHNASTADSGEYECRDARGIGPAACAWKLDVFAAPTVEITYPIHEHLVGVSTRVDCRASGYPSPVFNWLFNGTDVRSIDTFQESVEVKNERQGSMLRFFLAETIHSGTYTCVANNSRGQDETSISLVFRNVPKPVVSTERYIVFKERAQNISLPCVATDISKTNTEVTWYHNNSQLLHHKEHFFSNNTMASRLWIYDASDEDVGIYWCHVNVFMLVKKNSATRLIRAKEGLPLVTTENPIVSSPLGEPLNLHCSVTYPIYDVVKTSWTKNGSELRHSYTYPKETRGYVQMFTFSLPIKNVTLEDVGTYVCGVETVTGNNWTSIEVQIQSKTVYGPYSSAEPRVSTSTLVVIFLVAALGSIFAIVSALAIRYLYQVRHKKLAARYKYTTSSLEYKYETFLSFSNHDYEWATTHLIPLLDKYSFTYCITRQDFEVGKFMIENIADCIYQSCTVIAIMSKSFMASKYCQQELNLALYKSAELDDGCLIVIRIDDIEKQLLPKALRNRTFLDYADKEERKHWKRRLLKCLFSHTRSSQETHEDILLAARRRQASRDPGEAQTSGPEKRSNMKKGLKQTTHFI